MSVIAENTVRLVEPAPRLRDLTNLLEREGRIERAQRNAYYEIGLDLQAIRDGQLYKVERPQAVAGRYSFLTFEEYVEQRWEMAYSTADRLIATASVAAKISSIVELLPQRESHVRPLLLLESDSARINVWRQVVSDREGQPIRASDVEAAVERYKAAQSKDWLTLDEWSALDEQSKTVAMLVRNEKSTLNKQDSDSIEWAQWSWNPVTGCKHDCPYCYARDIANRFYPQKFEPSLYAGRLSALANTSVPEKAAADISYKNVFACSMSDLFGRWVPAEWIQAVLDAVRDNPQWNVLMLTKFPQRMAEFDIPHNAWMGTTVDCQARVKNAESAFEKVKCGVKWLSVEPMLEPLKFKRLDLFNWVVMGGSSRSTETPAWVPPLDWVVDLHSQARAAGCRVYYKTNIGMGDDLRLREFPWQEPTKKLLPKTLHYLSMK